MASRSRIKKRGRNKKTQKPIEPNGAVDFLAGAPAETAESAPSGDAPPSDASGSTDQPSEFEQIVAESQAAIAEKKSNARPGARRRGRPRKNRGVETAAAPAIAPTPAQSIVAPEPAPDISEIIKPPLIALSKIPAHRHQIPELALSPDEAAACAQALNGILQAFVPDQNTMSPKTAAVVMGLLTFGSVGFSKFSIYSAEMEKRAPAPVVTVQDENAEIPKSSQVMATDFFRKEIAQ